jgi:hypothetical protein
MQYASLPNISNFSCKIEFKYYAILIYTIGLRNNADASDASSKASTTS